jgi:hypothetical protein
MAASRPLLGLRVMSLKNGIHDLKGTGKDEEVARIPKAV